MNGILYKLLNNINPVVFGLGILGVCSLILFGLLDIFPSVSSFDFWDKFLSPLLGIFTAIMGFVIYIKQRLDTWVDNLPKLYTSHTFCNGKLIASCYDFQTTTKHDIRGVNQSFIKMKLNSGENLKLDAGNQIIKSDIDKIGNTWYNKYMFVSSLAEKPKLLSDGKYRFFEGGFPGKDFLQVSALKPHDESNPNEHLSRTNGAIDPAKLPFSYNQMISIIDNSLKQKAKNYE